MRHAAIAFDRKGEGRVSIRTLTSGAIALLIGMLAVSHVQACTFEQAHYRYSTNPDIEVSFKKLDKGAGWMSDLALHLTIRGGESYWFLFDGGSARYINMISVGDAGAPGWKAPGSEGAKGPLHDMHFFAWSKANVFFESMPMPGLPAPDIIFLPDLSETLWYVARPRVGVGHGLFLRYRCD